MTSPVPGAGFQRHTAKRPRGPDWFESSTGRADTVSLQLPAAYELVTLERVDSVVKEAARQAQRGAGEGTLIWAQEQTHARTPSGKSWYAPVGNLHCALIVEPEYDNVAAEQLAYVAMVSAGTAIADIVAPMTGLRWRWPDEIYINDLKSGLVQLAFPEGNAGPYPWLVLGLSVNVAEHPPNPEPERYNSLHASGTPEATVGDLLEAFSRHFLSWINRWAEQGFEPVRKAWLLRADGIGERISVSLGDGLLDGILKDVDAQGAADVERTDGGTRKLRPAEYFGRLSTKV